MNFRPARGWAVSNELARAPKLWWDERKTGGGTRESELRGGAGRSTGGALEEPLGDGRIMCRPIPSLPWRQIHCLLDTPCALFPAGQICQGNHRQHGRQSLTTTGQPSASGAPASTSVPFPVVAAVAPPWSSTAFLELACLD